MSAFKIKKLMTILTTIAVIITFTSGALSFLAYMHLFSKFKINSHEAASIGVIGGADEPTSIFITGIGPATSIAKLFGLLSVIGIICLIFTNKLKK